MIKYYFKILLIMIRNSIKIWISRQNKLLGSVIFEIVNLVFHFIFIYFILYNFKYLFDNNTNLIFLFSLTFLLIFVLSKSIYTNIYEFRQLITTNGFDLIIIKPINSLFVVLSSKINPIDLITILLIICFSFILFPIYGLFTLNMLIILMSFYIVVLSVTLSTKGRFTIEKIIIFFVQAVVMITLSSKYLIGFVDTLSILSTFLFALALLFLSIILWNNTSKKHTCSLHK